MAARKRIFVSFAVEDQRYRDLLKGQSLKTDSPFEYLDYSVKQPWSASWKTRCRERIRTCHGTVALLSRHTLTADGARWEITCSIDEGVPVLGVWIHGDDHSRPPEIPASACGPWDWDRIAAFIDKV